MRNELLELLKKARAAYFGRDVGTVPKCIDAAIAIVNGGKMYQNVIGQNHDASGHYFGPSVQIGGPCLVIPLPVEPVFTDYDAGLARTALIAWYGENMARTKRDDGRMAQAIAKYRAEHDASE